MLASNSSAPAAPARAKLQSRSDSGMGRSEFLTRALIATASVGVLVLVWSFASTATCVPVRLAIQSHAPSNDSRCSIRFQRYISSDLEQRWLDNIATWENDFCSAWDNDSSALIPLMKTIRSVQEGLPSGDIKSLSASMSRYEYLVTCDGVSSSRYMWIEPLVAALRHPLALCGLNGGADKFLVDRNYIVLRTASDLPDFAMGQNLYFDLGASMYSTGPGGASQQYFVEEYAKRGIVFDRMFLWEPKPSGNVFEKGFDPDMAYKYHYYTTFADPTPGSGFNPYTIMKKLGKPTDFIMFKLDIDTGPIEEKLVRQMFDDPQLVALVDEFFFEHHVNFEPMHKYWGLASDMNITMKDSYRMFLQLRKLGIRAHSWP